VSLITFGVNKGGKISAMRANPAPRGQRFDLLYRISQIFNSTLERDEILNRVIDEVIDATGAERGYIISNVKGGELTFHVARGIDHQDLDREDCQVSQGVIQQVIATWEPVLTHEASSDSRFENADSVIDLKLRSILCVPLNFKQDHQGVIYVENRHQGGIFSNREVELLTALAANTAVALENAGLFQDLQDQIQTQKLLYEINADLTSRLELDQLLTATLERMQAALSAPAASLLTIEGDELVFKVALGEKASEIKPFRIPIDEGLAGWVVQNAQGVIANDVQNDPRFFRQADAKSGFVTENLIAAPLLVKEQAIGLIELFNKAGGFTGKDLDLLTAIASTASIAIDNARLYQAAIDKGRMERELQMALNVQTGLLPDKLPEVPGWDFATRWQPAREVSGDFYDFLDIEDRLSQTENKLGLVIADVTDKGMPAALFMAFTRSIIRASLHQVNIPENGITQANQLICHESTHGLFVSLFYGQLDPATGELIYVNAGHNPPLHYQAATSKLVRLMPTGIPIGVVEDFSYKQERIILEAGDFIFCYTDGITEAINPEQEAFGLERLEKVVMEQREASPEVLTHAVKQAVLGFTQTEILFDDMTSVVVKKSR